MWWMVAAHAWSFRLELGGQFERASHGIANVYARKGGLSLALITDTLQVRYDKGGTRGRWWLAGRGEAGAVGLMSTTWVDGVPSPTASQLGFYVGPEGGAVVYGPSGFYVGAQAWVRYYAFAGLAQTEVVSKARPAALPELIAGWYSDEADLYVRAGAMLAPGRISPGVHGTLRVHPTGVFAPWIEVRGGLANNTDLVNKVRLGGLNPYVVPLAGAAWSEFWVEDYIAVRVGPRVSVGKQWMAPVLDAAVFDGRSVLGIGGMGHLGWKGWGLDVGAGTSPFIRPARRWSFSVYGRLTLDIAGHKKAKEKTP